MTTAQLITRGPWQQPVKVIGAMCEDATRRTARITASVHVKGKTVSGFITGCEGENGEQDYRFIAVLTGKNHALLSN